MPVPKILLLSRKTLELNFERLQPYLEGVNIEMAVAVAPEDAEVAKKLTEAVAQFQHVTAIVADFGADMAVNDDGSVELLGMTVVRDKEQTKLISSI